MHNFDIVPLLREALKISGCSDKLVGAFDGHSTIELQIDNLPALNIDVLDNELWLWSRLIESGSIRLEYTAEHLLRFLMRGCPFAKTEQMQIIENNDILEVRVMLASSAYADGQSFANAMDAYLADLATLCDIIRR